MTVGADLNILDTLISEIINTSAPERGMTRSEEKDANWEVFTNHRDEIDLFITETYGANYRISDAGEIVVYSSKLGELSAAVKDLIFTDDDEDHVRKVVADRAKSIIQLLREQVGD